MKDESSHVKQQRLTVWEVLIRFCWFSATFVVASRIAEARHDFVMAVGLGWVVTRSTDLVVLAYQKLRKDRAP